MIAMASCNNCGHPSESGACPRCGATVGYIAALAQFVLRRRRHRG